MGSESPSRWQNVGTSAELMAQAGRSLEAGSATRTPTDVAEARDALLAVTSTAARLARQLDMLASAYPPSNLAEASAVHVALDQAAAAAEDLGNCTRVAAQAIDDDE